MAYIDMRRPRFMQSTPSSRVRMWQLWGMLFDGADSETGMDYWTEKRVKNYRSDHRFSEATLAFIRGE